MILVVACLAAITIGTVFAADDHVGVETEVCGVTLSKYILHSGYTLPAGGHECERYGTVYTYSGWVNSADETDLELFTIYEWWIRIRVCASDIDPAEKIEDVVLADRFGAEFGVCIVDYKGGDSGEEPEIYTKGNSEKVFLKWDIGDIEAGKCATIWLHVWTDHNPAGKQEFTSYGTYYINSGAVAKWKIGRTKYSAETGQLMVSTVSPP
jgi:hypothetical protein